MAPLFSPIRRRQAFIAQPVIILAVIILACIAVACGGLARAGAAEPETVPPKIMLYGDSLLAGLGLSEQYSFMGQLQAAMRQAGLEAELINASVSGDTSTDGLARLEWSLADPPDAVILGLGANDMLQGVAPATVRANLDALLGALAERGLPVLLLGMKADRGLGPDYVAKFDAIYPELARDHQILLDPFFLEGVALDPARNQPDLRHPNAQGVAHIVARLIPLVEQLLAKINR